MVLGTRGIIITLALIFFALITNFLPTTWLLYIPTVLVWGAVCVVLARLVAPFIDEFLERYRDD